MTDRVFDLQVPIETTALAVLPDARTVDVAGLCVDEVVVLGDELLVAMSGGIGRWVVGSPPALVDTTSARFMLRLAYDQADGASRDRACACLEAWQVARESLNLVTAPESGSVLVDATGRTLVFTAAHRQA